ncbi:oleate-activated transcription factor OAF1 KNAG_0E04150 [Huiozyma naganishii CBS 8797]|uniref:Zn(2)-C6 fungal-type domain-containing protein n=1 Tax=Huiozyma naganishii (strain ATCC MYA-139 / BCRC 22969 / CBS 8797 / KCTC 17520 / NBRC 10181 / NCYC 3082 / Yp74L-3) TaxID=1071383 RepID=J7RM98_HUIN7|nr:hypothetical protein KNAG_0E04150 [Kazachstania naganishii CBS 8797]CCK70668.1 hypothetical protein KNAG_0E04150 [Kazachstania naganishii CBS 8797]
MNLVNDGWAGQRDLVSPSYSPQITPDIPSSSSSSSSNIQLKKRNRISFVCQNCRKSKMKCDREKPECTRCLKQGIKCVYDEERQPRPRIPNKDATIAKLERDVKYWQTKAMKLLGQQQDQITKKRTFTAMEEQNVSTDVFNKVTAKTRNIETNDDDSLDDIEINLYKEHPKLIFSKVMKHDVKPLSENYVITQDKFIASCIASVFISPAQNTMIPALTANANIARAQPSVRDNVLKLKSVLMAECTDPEQRVRIDDFTDRILQNTNSSRNLKIGMILSMLYNTVGRQFLEDRCSGEYSELLQSFIQEFETILPPFEVIQKYKTHFCEYIFPNLPFLQREMFEESIQKTLFPDPENPTKIKLNLGNTHLREKIENLSTLLVILKLSYISLRYIIHSDDDPRTNSGNSTYVTNEELRRYPITNDAILLAQRCLASENWCACANENIITCLLYIWSFFAFSPEEGDLFLEHPTDIISSLIMMLSTSIGLHRDPDDFPQLRDPSLSDKRSLNQRRLLWVSVVGICSFESTLKGRHPLLASDLMCSFLSTSAPNSVKHYMEKVSRDLVGENNETLLKIHEFTVKRAELSLLLSDLDNLTMSYNNTFSLRFLELSREKIEIFVEENFPLLELDKSTKRKGKGSKFPQEDIASKLNFLATQNSNALQSRIIAKLMFLRASVAVFLHFEVKVLEDESFLPYYYKYFIQTCVDALNLVKFFNDFFAGSYSDFVYKSTNYNVTKVIQLALPSALFCLVGMILRVNAASDSVFAAYQGYNKKGGANTMPAEKSAELNAYFERITFLQGELESSLQYIYIFSSKYLRFNYFSIFKLFAVFDVILQRVSIGKLWLSIYKMAHTKNLHSRIVKNLRMTLGVQLDKGEDLVKELKQRNHLNKMSINDLTKLCQEVHNIFETMAKPMEKEGTYMSSMSPTFAPTGDKQKENNNYSAGNNENDGGGIFFERKYPNGVSDSRECRNGSLESKFKLEEEPGVGSRSSQMFAPFSYISALNNLQKLSSAATLSQNLDFQTKLKKNRMRLILWTIRKIAKPSGQPMDVHDVSNNGNLSSQGFNKLHPGNVQRQAYSDRGPLENFSHGNTNLGGNMGSNSVLNNYMKGNEEAVPTEYSAFFGGLDLFDYDFFFGSDVP